MSEWKAQRVERKMVQRSIVDARPVTSSKKNSIPGDWLVVGFHRGRWSVYSALRSEPEAFKQVAKTQRCWRYFVVHRHVFDAFYKNQRLVLAEGGFQ